jgi:exportin-1
VSDLRKEYVSPVTDRAVAFDLVNNFANTSPDIANQFFQQYLTNLLGDILYVLTDADHKSGMSSSVRPSGCKLTSSGFKNQVEGGSIAAPLFDPATVSDPSMSNATYLRGYVADLLSNAFQNMQPYAAFRFPLRYKLMDQGTSQPIRKPDV